MSKTLLTILAAVLLNVSIGCHSAESGRGQILPREKPAPDSANVITPAAEKESDLIEEVAIHRKAYRNGLEMLKGYYEQSGNNMKLQWAEKELGGLKDVTQYDYIIEAAVAGPDLKAVSSIPLANYMYEDGVRQEKKAWAFVVIPDENRLRQALSIYNGLIRKHPSSDKIDDSAYHAAGIYEHFKDYSIALLYYKRAYQWDSSTSNPARYKSARLLDEHMAQRVEALELYREALAKEQLTKKQKDKAQTRIDELTKKYEQLEEVKGSEKVQ